MSAADEAPRALLRISLEAAVPLWIAQMKGCSYEQIEARAKVCSQYIAEHGDVLQFKSSRKGETAEAFNRLAEGLACLSFFPGGVTFIGLHFEAKLLAKEPM